MPPIRQFKTLVVACKHCRENIPSGSERVPSQPVIVRCPLCTERRHYLPNEVFLGAPSYKLAQAG